MKKYVYQGETFEVSKPKNCRIEVKGKGLIGAIVIHEATGTYREEVLGWGTDQYNLGDALNAVCQRILNRAGKPTGEDLCKPMGEFYEKLSS